MLKHLIYYYSKFHISMNSIYEEEKIDDKNKLLWKFIPSNKINNYYIQNKYNSLFLGTNNPMLKSNHQIKINCSFKK